ncbi:DHH family phosphoesterase [Caviibacter abscessus]|uniref:DHH family phosphoesterase n=1 Tax=Caviibacter abscessus TaxID=1766719 RepID=UPI0008352AB2|nr:bifunctional oligoribonuclease/PAP phosphatase NrnA [Caviibacter abscessus]
MLKKIKEQIDNAKNIVIAGHVNPDGDAIGSAIALSKMIKQYGSSKNVKVCFNDELPEYTKELLKDINIYKEVTDDIDLLISVDTANLERLAVTKEMIEKAKKTVCIDHHISNTGYFDINYIKDISSASELIYDFLDVLNIKLSKEIAEFMYLGIINDTGNFRHSNVTSNTFRICANLLDEGINASYITQVLFSKSNKKAEIFSKAIIDKIYFEDIKFAYYYLKYEDMLKLGITKDDTDGIAEYLLTIKENDITLFLREEADHSIKGSFRSKFVNVNYIASFFGGGGHIKAAGFKTNMAVDDIIGKVRELLK